MIFVLFANSLFSQSDLTPEEYPIGTTWYDVQTTRSMQDRIYHFEDGTIGAVFNFSNDPTGFEDLGVGYNYYNGSNWGPWPTSTITSGPSLNPCYTKYGENGEIVASEGENGLFINYRVIKGIGDWQEMIFPGPTGCTKLYSPQIATSGPDNLVIHILALCKNDSIQLNYQDNIGKVLYSRTSDGGITWDILHFDLGIISDSFGFSELSLIWAEPKDDVLAFVVGDYFTNLILVKSDDGGNNWQQTIIWEHPHPFMEFGTTVTDTFWANTGSMDIALDVNLRANVVFSLCHIASTISTIWYNDPWADGIVYWNEDMDVFSNNINALNPQVHPDSELIEDYNLIAWTQDINGNGELDFLPFGADNPAFYPSLGLSTMPSISTTDNGTIIVIWSSLTETFNNGINDYRHLWVRGSPNNGIWWGGFCDLTSDLMHIFDECVFPNTASFADDYLHLIYQLDNEPGLNNNSGGFPSENKINYMKVDLFGWPPPSIEAQFIADTTTIYEGDTIHFTNLSIVCPPGIVDSDWIFEGGNPSTSTENEPLVVYNTPGIYNVTLTATSYMLTDTELKEDYITVLPEVGISETGNVNEVIIFPNPTTGKIIIDLQETNTEIKIFNLFGEMVFKDEFLNYMREVQIDLLGNQAGIYFLEIKSENVIFIEKFIIKY